MSTRLWQRLTMRWQKLVFGEREVTAHVRALRLLEEVLELCQCEDVTLEQIDTITSQVYRKDVGNTRQELGGVLICVALYAATKNEGTSGTGHDMEECFWEEFERIMDPAMMEKVRTRNLSGDKIGMRE